MWRQRWWVINSRPLYSVFRRCHCFNAVAAFLWFNPSAAQQIWTDGYFHSGVLLESQNRCHCMQRPMPPLLRHSRIFDSHHSIRGLYLFLPPLSMKRYMQWINMYNVRWNCLNAKMSLFVNILMKYTQKLNKKKSEWIKPNGGDTTRTSCKKRVSELVSVFVCVCNGCNLTAIFDG